MAMTTKQRHTYASLPKDEAESYLEMFRQYFEARVERAR